MTDTSTLERVEIELREGTPACDGRLRIGSIYVGSCGNEAAWRVWLEEHTTSCNQRTMLCDEHYRQVAAKMIDGQVGCGRCHLYGDLKAARL